jgi:hypothetical protein
MNLSGKHHRIAQQECVGRNNKRLMVKGVKGVKRSRMTPQPPIRNKPKKAKE